MYGKRGSGSRNCSPACGPADGDAAAAAEELVRLLLGLYGDGLSHIMDALAAEGAAGDAGQ